MKSMILAAGLGTRLKTFTDKHPKALLVINGKTLLQRNIEYLAGFGIREIIVNIHHFADQVKEFIAVNKGFGSTVSISDESKEILETGGGLKKASWYFKDGASPFVLMNVDVLTDMDLGSMINMHKEKTPLATLAVTQRDTSRYLLFDQEAQLCGWKNLKTGEQKIIRPAAQLVPKAFSGIHVISPEIFPLIHKEGKFSMIDLYLELAQTQTVIAFDHTYSKFLDVGKPESIVMAEKIFD